MNVGLVVSCVQAGVLMWCSDVFDEVGFREGVEVVGCRSYAGC